jgi:hypothetical protein
MLQNAKYFPEIVKNVKSSKLAEWICIFEMFRKQDKTWLRATF